MTRKAIIQLQRLMIGILCLVLAACQSKTAQATTPTPELSKAPTLTRTVSPSVTPENTITPTVPPTESPTSTPVPAGFEIIKTSIRESGEWNLAFPFAEPNLPEVITVTVDGFRLDPDFEVQSIDLSYEWWGLGEPIFDNQRIERQGDRFRNDNKEVSANHVKSLIKSIVNLHPEPLMLNTITHTDDYPKWSIELTGEDGTHILLLSNSNGPNFAPWNVIYNGKIFTQFDGQIANALSKLFEVSEGQPMAWTSAGSPEEGFLNVGTIGWPGQLVHGFSGLLSVQSGFNYSPDLEKGEIHGYLRGRYSIGGMGNMIVGSIVDLENIELEVDNHQFVSCRYRVVPSDDASESAWEFVCPVGKLNVSETYRFPIQVTFRTDLGQTITSSGNLFGYWEQRIVLSGVPFPKEIGKILSESSVFQDLITDHEIAVLNFNGAADPVTGSMDHQWTADIVVLGQAKLDTRILPYSVTTRVKVEDGQLTQWDLDRAEIQALLQDVLSQTITRRFLDGDPNLKLNLYYSRSAENPIITGMSLGACADLPVADGLPNRRQPLRAFSFNQSWHFYGIGILIIDGKLRFENLNIQPSLPEHAVWTSLLPVELVPENAPPFSEIEIWSWSTAVSISWDPKADEADINIYKELINTLPGNKNIEAWGAIAMLNPVMMGITTDGRLSLISCEDQ